MTASVIATTVTTPDTSRAYTVACNGADLTTKVFLPSLVFEEQGTNTQATTTFAIRNATIASLTSLAAQGLVTVYDHVSDSGAFRGFIDSRAPARRPAENEIAVIASDHTSLLDNIIPLEARPAGESDAARLGYLWGKYAGAFLNADFSQVQTIESSMPAQQFAGVSLRQAIDMIAAQASSSAFWYLDTSGRLHYGASESNDAPYNITSDTPGAGEIAADESLSIDWDSKGFTTAVYVRGKTDDGSGWVQSESAKLVANGVQRTTFLDAPDCTTEAMKTALGNMYLGRLNAAKARGSFTVFSTAAAPLDGWRAGQNVNVRSSHHGVDQAWRIARVKTTVLGPATNRRYDVEFGNARAGTYLSGADPSIVMGRSISGDLVDDNGALLLSSTTSGYSGGLGPALRRYITSGVYNGDFALAPPAPDSAIVNSWNPLPFWTFVAASGTSIYATSVADSSAGSGRAIRWDMSAGAAGDDAYLEQIVPVNSSRGQAWFYNPRATFETGSTVSLAKAYITVQYLKADGTTTTGVAATSELTTTSIGTNTIADVSGAASVAGEHGPPSDAAFASVKIGFKRDAAATSVEESVMLAEAYLISGTVRMFVPDDTDPKTFSPARILQSGGVATIVANFDGGDSGSIPTITLDGSGATPAIAINGPLSVTGQIAGIDPTVQVYTSSDTWSKPTGLTHVIVQVVGGGGAGGGADASGSGQNSKGSGGGAGSYARTTVAAADLGSTETVTVGAGGSGSSGADGGDGGDSSFGSHATASGGSGGINAGPTSATFFAAIGGAGGAAGTGDVAVDGANGEMGAGGGNIGIGGSGAPGPWGGGGLAKTSGSANSGAAGNAGTGYGSGGGGAYTTTTHASAYAGGDGADGVVIVTEFYGP